MCVAGLHQVATLVDVHSRKEVFGHDQDVAGNVGAGLSEAVGLKYVFGAA